MADFIFSHRGDRSPEAAAYAYKQWQGYQERQKLVSALTAFSFFAVLTLAAVDGRPLWKKARPAITRRPIFCFPIRSHWARVLLSEHTRLSNGTYVRSIRCGSTFLHQSAAAAIRAGRRSGNRPTRFRLDPGSPWCVRVRSRVERRYICRRRAARP